MFIGYSGNINRREELQKGFETAFVDGNVVSDLNYQPEFISNNPKEGKKVLSSIESELSSCDSFRISVAFITMGGLVPLLQVLKDLKRKGIKGQLLTTNYLNFSEPKALNKIHELGNIEIKMYDVNASAEGFHTKGYIFKKEELFHIIIGSSNMTSSALMTNKEWNTRLVSLAHGEVTESIIKEYEELWNSEYSRSYKDIIEEYSIEYEISKHQREAAKYGNITSIEKYVLRPNAMQIGFIRNLRGIISNNKSRALLISATGTGKTYAAAFAMRELGFNRVLFLAHRTQLVKQAKKSFERVFDHSKTMGIVGSGNYEYDNDFVFATRDTLRRSEHLKKYGQDYFDCIIVDEAHHVPADTYQTIMSYFKPCLWLGMTATPDKRDDGIPGKNVYELFDYQIAYEIRLQQAMEEKLLCPFHYFGIEDIEIDDADIAGERSISIEKFNKLVSDERIRHIIEQANYYGYSGDRVKGLIFCSRIDESIELSIKMNSMINPETGRKYRTIALNGDSSEEEREEAFERLAMNESASEPNSKALDYIFSVEILNEGVDIVEVNQVIMLRPTRSPIVFVQQLGRGLRKSEGKEYVVILDFIGNYKNNFMIPIALSGDRTYNKDNLRRYLLEGGRIIPGESTIHFEEICKKKIFNSIESANFSDSRLLLENYKNLKNKLGKIPSLMDFDIYGEMDIMRIIDNNNYGSYYKFLVAKEKDNYKIRFSEKEAKYIEYISKKFIEGKRIHELLILKSILSNDNSDHNVGVFSNLGKVLHEKYNKRISAQQEINLINILTNNFITGAGKDTYSDCIFIEKEGNDYQPAKGFIALLSNRDFKNALVELVEFGIHRYNKNYSNTYKESDFVLYQKYTYEDVCRLLNWEKNEVPLNIGGYKFDRDTKTFPVFINYDKKDDINDTIKYRDRFAEGSNNKLVAISKSNRTIDSDDVQNFLKARERGIEVSLFVRKNNSDAISKEFYFLGHMNASGFARSFTMENTSSNAVEIEWILENPVRTDIYEYLTKG